MKRIVAVAAAVLILLTFSSCFLENVVSEETTAYDIPSDIHTLTLQINAADVRIEHGDRFAVESNLKHLSVSAQNGVLSVIDKANSLSRYNGATLTLYIPQGTVFDRADITTGAGMLSADTLSCASLTLTLGAGNVRFDSLHTSSDAVIKGGAGQFTVADGELHNLTLEMGVGQLNLCAALRGSSQLAFGIGESNVTLLGNKRDYKTDISKGIGNISVDGKTVSDFGSSGNGIHRVTMQGGIGNVNITFKE